MPSLSASQIAGAAQAAGFTGANLTIAVAVALAESGGNPTASHKNSNGSTDYGLWQINSVHSSLLASGNWQDPTANAKMAFSVFQGSGWKAWTTYSSGAYLKNMSAAQGGAGTPDIPAGGGLGGAVSGAPTLSAAESGDVTSIGSALTFLTSSSMWIRVGYFMAGLFFLGLAIFAILRRTGVISKAVGIAKKAAVFA